MYPFCGGSQPSMPLQIVRRLLPKSSQNLKNDPTNNRLQTVQQSKTTGDGIIVSLVLVYTEGSDGKRMKASFFYARRALSMILQKQLVPVEAKAEA